MVRCSPGYSLPLGPSGNAHYCGPCIEPAGEFSVSSWPDSVDGMLLMVEEFTLQKMIQTGQEFH